MLDQKQQANSEQDTQRVHSETFEQKTETTQKNKPKYKYDKVDKKWKKYLPSIIGIAAVFIALLFIINIFSGYDINIFSGYDGTTETATETISETATETPAMTDNAVTKTVKPKSDNKTRINKEPEKPIQTVQRTDDEESFNKYKKMGDAYWVSYTTSRFQDEDARLKVLQYYGEALKYKNDSEIRRKYNTLLDN